jgi:predicted nucleic acid-binding protein
LISPGEKVFVDTEAWITLAEKQDALHERAPEDWTRLTDIGVRPRHLHCGRDRTFTFLDRKGSRDAALRWRASLEEIDPLEILGVAAGDVKEAWRLFERRDLHKLSLVDALSFTLMRKHRIRTAFSFDVHFSLAGSRYV